MSNIDPLQRAADCARAMQITADPEQRKMLLNLQKLWIALSIEEKPMSDAERAKLADRIGRLHDELTNSGWRGLHARKR
jgi:hypothetical protein